MLLLAICLLFRPCQYWLIPPVLNDCIIESYEITPRLPTASADLHRSSVPLQDSIQEYSRDDLGSIDSSDGE